MKKLSQTKKEVSYETYEISFFFLFITTMLTIITYKSFGSVVSFLTLGILLISHYLFSQIKSCKAKKLYKVHTYKYTEYGKNAC